MATADLSALILTNEYPPSVYGGAGIHVGELTRALRARIGLDIRTFGDHDDRASRASACAAIRRAHDLAGADERMRGAWAALSRDLAMAIDPVAANVVHCHTWYTHLAGLLVRQAYGIPLAVTVHSLEPLRPWKREQLGGGYDVSTWVERQALESADAVIAVSQGTRADVLRLFDVAEERLHVIHNGIDAELLAARSGHRRAAALWRRPIHAVRPVRGSRHAPEGDRPPGAGHPRTWTRASAWCCAPASRTRPEIAREMEEGVEAARAHRSDIVWIPEMLSRSDVRQLYRMRRCSSAHRSMSRSGSSTWRRWPASGRWWPARWAAFRRWWSTARRAAGPGRPARG